MRVFLGAALFLVLSGVALFGIGLARADTYYIASGIPLFFIGTIFAGIVLGKCVGQEIAEEVDSTAIVAQQGRTVANTINTTSTTKLVQCLTVSKKTGDTITKERGFIAD